MVLYAVCECAKGKAPFEHLTNCGGVVERDPPVPIPNTAVKPLWSRWYLSGNGPGE